MNLLKGALQKPVTIVVVILAILFFSYLAIKKMRVDIFPQLGLPTVYVAQPYGGLSPEQMEGFVTSYYEYHFLYVTGVKFVESKSIQGAALIKIQFNEGTDMSQAMAEVVGYVNRAKAFMPPGTVPPFITRFDAGSVPVGELVFTSKTRTLGEISDLALFRVRPMFATLPGVSAPPPFGGNQKTVIVNVDPNKVREYNLSPDEIVQALAKANSITPAGNIREGDKTLITSQNAVVNNVQELANVPIRIGAGPTVYIRDISSVNIGSDITTSYALVNGKRSVYIPVTKRSDASTWDVVQRVKAALPDMQAAVPSDIKVAYEFDQSGYVINSVKSLSFEGALGAVLTGLMVLFFLGDQRSALIVVLTIPMSILSAIILLNLFGQTINIMTLGGLALAVGILVDEGTVTIENIHRHLEMGKSKGKAILDGCREIFIPKLLILLCILSVFVPSLFMSGVPEGMFLPLSLSVGFAMISSFLISNTIIPVFSNWILKGNQFNHSGSHRESRFEIFRHKYIVWLEQFIKGAKWKSMAYVLGSMVLVVILFSLIGTDIFPKVDAGQAQVRLRMPTGTRIERTESATQKLLHLADSITKGNIEASSAFIGTQPSSFPINLVYLWTSGPQESVIKFNLNKEAGIGIENFKEQMREAVHQSLPDATISFEPGDLVEQVLNLGSSNPIEIAVLGRDLSQSRVIAEKLNNKLKSITYLRDVQIATPLDYPEIKIDIDRVKAGQLGLTVDQISKSTVAATSSSRFTQPNYWLDKSSGIAYQVQIEYPQYKINSNEQLGLVPVSGNIGNPVYLRDAASMQRITTPGEYDRINQQRFITITANIHNKDLGTALKEVNVKIASLSQLPQGVKIMLRGQSELLHETMSELQSGLLIAIIVIFLMLAVNFQSFKLSLTILSIIPTVVAGSILLLLLTGKTLNIQSYMGTIMAVGVAVANAILFVTNAELHRKRDFSSGFTISATFNRLRPILMTNIAMIAGMIPMSLGIGEGGDQSAPLAIAVIGGLIFSAVSTLIFLPMIYSYVVGNQPYKNPSFDPEDENSIYYEAGNTNNSSL
ncbi:MAG: AcrB/AcrD/AcrF family protein [Hydrotalea flava]|nr:efflux RND transporter permease subunit [Hydrotalea flava]NIM36521.1 AcrB/AcrD/AcrF family protein [Hydrotalea flava]NIM39380.1 AcrB/AcrD/AcrF family protein [Hydrotalea flava]NIN04569.1 AcrB/AcrD/AcrF family protein [Hydrotalea flava]NIN16241.1 AcrB/AcrD/AcrF family protein [Hydrotalea flava]